MFPKPKYTREGDTGDKNTSSPDPYVWLKFIDWAADGKIKDYDYMYELNWAYLCSILSMKLHKKKQEEHENIKQRNGRS